MKHKQIISALLLAVVLICSVPHAVIAEGENFVCNCDTLPCVIEMQKVRELQYTPEELAQWAEHRLAHTRIPELLIVPYVVSEENAIETQRLLQELIGEQGSVVCETPIERLPFYQFFVSAPEEVIAEVMPEILEAGIFCDGAIYHELPALDSDAPFRMPSYITIEDGILWNPNVTFGLFLNKEKIVRKEYTRQELLMYIGNALAMDPMRYCGKLYMRYTTDDAQTLADELAELTGASVTFQASAFDSKAVYFFIHADESDMPQVMFSLLSEGYDVSLDGVSTFPENKPFVCGDMDFDGEIGSKDFMMLKRIVLKTFTPAAQQTEIADVNCDGNVDAKDYMMLKRHVLGTYKITKGKLIDMSSYWS